MRTLTSLVLFGPVTLLRPALIVGVAVWAAASVRSVDAWAVTGLGVGLVFEVEALLERTLWRFLVDARVP